ATVARPDERHVDPALQFASAAGRDVVAVAVEVCGERNQYVLGRQQVEPVDLAVADEEGDGLVHRALDGVPSGYKLVHVEVLALAAEELAEACLPRKEGRERAQKDARVDPEFVTPLQGGILVVAQLLRHAAPAAGDLREREVCAAERRAARVDADEDVRDLVVAELFEDADVVLV